MKWIIILDWVTSFLVVGNFWYASVKNERVNSKRYNWFQIIGGVLMITTGYYKGLYGMIFRQLFFVIIATRNLFNQKPRT